jgi:hypothetical protein
VGCPIRRSRDQRSLASPPGFSQRATSFIASQCQGIHQMPFSSLLAPHPTARTISGETPRVSPRATGESNRFRRKPRYQKSDIRSQNRSVRQTSLQKTHFGGTHRHESTCPHPDASASVTQLASSQLSINIRSRHPKPDAGEFAAAAAFQKPECRYQKSEWQIRSRRYFRYLISGFCSLTSGGERARTVDLLLAKQALSQLSYTPVARTQNRSTQNHRTPAVLLSAICTF